MVVSIRSNGVVMCRRKESNIIFIRARRRINVHFAPGQRPPYQFQFEDFQMEAPLFCYKPLWFPIFSFRCFLPFLCIEIRFNKSFLSLPFLELSLSPGVCIYYISFIILIITCNVHQSINRNSLPGNLQPASTSKV